MGRAPLFCPEDMYGFEMKRKEEGGPHFLCTP